MPNLEYDPGPPSEFFEHFKKMPSYEPFKEYFWIDWGPIFYRGRLDGTAKVLCIASDPGPAERIAGRTLVGDAGQRTQGFIEKIGLKRSYLCLNAYSVALFPRKADDAEREVLPDQEHLTWRNKLYDLAKSPSVKAVIAFGEQAQRAVAMWPGASSIRVFRVPHPSSREETVLLDKWRAAITSLRDLVTPDSGGDPAQPNYGLEFTENDYRRIPAFDLPFGAASFLGDDAHVRATGTERNSVRRLKPDDRHTLHWIAPKVFDLD